MKRISFSILAFCLSFSTSAQAKVDVLFHPTDPTLEKIATWIEQAERTVDIAMYNMDTTAGSPIVQVLQKTLMKQRLQQGDLSVRFIFEGYGTAEENKKKAEEIEALGFDVRFVKSGKHVHHKFAVIDANSVNARVVTGSANWSLSSYKNYDENILFLEQEAAATQAFGTEFERLWKQSEEFGIRMPHEKRELPEVGSGQDIEAFFNSPRFLEGSDADENVLTSQLVRLIDGAQSEIVIATTRSRIEAVNVALRAAADRGVKIKMILSQDDYRDLWKRAKLLLGHPNLELRIKFYNLKPSQYLTYQMHNKWMVIDKKTILTGSFNWSDSSENQHIENLVELDGKSAMEVLPKYLSRFDLLWERGRSTLPTLLSDLESKKQQGELPTCGFAPIALTYEEVRSVLKLAPKCGSAE